MKHKIINIGITFLVILSMGFALFAMWTVFTTKEGEVPKIGGISLLRVISGSMEPKIPSGSVLLVKEVIAEELTMGDIISYYSRDPAIAEEINTHRIVEIGEQSSRLYFVTRGDANSLNDPYVVYGEDLVGKVIFSSRILGWFVGIATNKFGYLFVVLLPVILIFVTNVRDVVRLFKKVVKEEIEAEDNSGKKEEENGEIE